jgi:HAD superfamily hydrolase (TIGR01509 family)
MTMLPLASSELRQLISRTRELLLDFDGPICSVFAGMPADAVAEQFRCRLRASGITLPSETYSISDPLEVFRAVAAVGREASERAQRELTALEVKAVTAARPADGAAELITAARQSGRRVTIVSNNSGQAIVAYLDAHGLARHVTAVIGRDDPDPDHMKPSPYPVRKALRILGAASARCVLIGDSVSDIAAAHSSGVAVIGYANKPGKAERLSLGGADVTVTRLADITAALSAAALKA